MGGGGGGGVRGGDGVDKSFKWIQGQAPPLKNLGARCSSVVRAFAHGAMGRRIDPSWGGPIELFLVPASDPRLV